MAQLIENKDLGLNLENRFNRTLLPMLKRLFGVDSINKLYEKCDKDNGEKAFIDSLFEELHINVNVRGASAKPEEMKGPLIIISNYTQGAIDMLILLREILSYRTDIKVIVPDFLMTLTPLCNLFIAEDSQTPLHIIKHLKSGGALIYFPSMSVSRPKTELFERNNCLWNESIFKIAHRYSIPILPCTIYNTNSAKYFIIKKINNTFSTLRTLIEIVNKHNTEQLLLHSRLVKPELFLRNTSIKELSEIVRISMALSYLNAVEIDDRSTREYSYESQSDLKLSGGVKYTENQQFICKSHPLNECDTALVVYEKKSLKPLCYLKVHTISEALSTNGEESLWYYDSFEISRRFPAEADKTIEASVIMHIRESGGVAAQKFLISTLLEYFTKSKAEQLLTISVASTVKNPQLTAILSDYISANYLDKSYSKNVISRILYGHRTPKITALLSRRIIDTRKFFQYFMRDVDEKNEIFTTDFKLKIRTAGKIIGLGLDKKSGELTALLLINKGELKN